MLICFAIGIGIVKEEETNHIVESKGVEIKKNKERERERKERKLFASCHEELYYKRYQEG
jgi:hypothetical protein